MLTYTLKKSPGVPLYEALYRCIRRDILSGKLAPGEKLPSKRALAANLDVSKITVETAYGHLLAEGYLRAEEKVGYFVEEVERPVQQPEKSEEPEPEKPALPASGPARFPFSVWSRLQREVVLDYGEKLLLPMPAQGIPELRQAIADHLLAFRGIRVSPRNILVGAGTDFMYNLLVQLLGRDKVYGVEEPGYSKIRKIYLAAGVRCVPAMMDSRGVVPEKLGSAQVLHISPSHHFPTGLVTPMQRRQELLDWVRQAQDRWIVEDDYDSEFRFNAHPVPTLSSMDRAGRVIYMNTFSKTLAPSIRISYMVLPEQLMEQFRRRLGFYSCTVPSFEQYTLARFLSRGHFEKHINRMRKFYKNRRNNVLSALKNSAWADKLTILEKDAGLHFLLKVHTSLDDAALTRICRKTGFPASVLSDYYWGPVPESDRRCLVVSYAGLSGEVLEKVPEKREI